MSRKAKQTKRRVGILLAFTLMLALTSSEVLARDAAFMDPGAGAGGDSNEAIRVEPKSEIETGESVLNVARHVTLFYVNQTTQPIKVEKISVNGDGNITADIVSDDCSKQGTIPSLSRCSLEISVTPSSPGPWSVDALLTHSGAGRIARAKISGKTGGTTAAEKKETGLMLSSKENSAVNFGDVDTGSKAVRSALMVNDSPETITLYSIDVIEADKTLQKLEQGCATDMELKPGESCPVTMAWTPENKGQISTDLIIRHSGRLGFAVVPIRGNARGGPVEARGGGEKNESKSSIFLPSDNAKPPSSIPLPPSATDLDKVTKDKVPAVSADILTPPSGSSVTTTTAAAPEIYRLIGTIGNRAVILKPDGQTAIVNVSEDFEVGDKKAKLVSLTGKTADIMIDGKKKTLTLGAAPEITSKASTRSTDAVRIQSSEDIGGPTPSGILPNTAATPASTPGASVPSATPLITEKPSSTYDRGVP